MQFSGEGCPLLKDVGPRAGRSKRALEVFCFWRSYIRSVANTHTLNSASPAIAK